MSHQPTAWRTSSFSSNGSNCVEVLERPDGTWLRDSKDRRGPALHLGPAPWRAFLAAVAAGSDPGGVVRVRPGADGGRRVEDVDRAETLHFTSGEWSAFRRGVRAGSDPAGDVRVCPDPEGGRRVEDVARAEALHFTPGEWSAFRSGVRAGEFGGGAA